ncbi:MAG: aspartate dehydrogenase [Rhizobiaceae bacterium]
MRLGLIGFGNIATGLLALMRDTGLGLQSLTVLTRPERAGDALARIAAELSDLTGDVAVVTATAELLSSGPDLVVECAGHQAVSDHVPAILEAGVDTIVVSIGALADERLYERLRRAAIAGGSRIVLPSGAIGGIDFLAAMSAADGLAVTYRGIKPPRAWAGTAAEKALDLDALCEPATFFSGSAGQAARTYPKNANVAATLALAGAGFENTRVELVADPGATGNRHVWELKSPLAEARIEIANAPSAGNAKTSMATVYSVLREVRNRIEPMVI